MGPVETLQHTPNVVLLLPSRRHEVARLVKFPLATLICAGRPLAHRR